MAKPIVARLTKAVGTYPKGAELGFDSVADAISVLGDGTFKVDRYQSGEAYEPPKAASTPSPPADSGDTDVQVVQAQSATRAQLNDHARELGIEDPESFANKDVLFTAIQERQATS